MKPGTLTELIAKWEQDIELFNKIYQYHKENNDDHLCQYYEGLIAGYYTLINELKKL